MGNGLRRLFLAVMLALPLAYCGLFWHWLREVENTPPVTAAAKAVFVQAKAPAPDWRVVGDLFGDAEHPIVDQAVKESSLSLRLLASYVAVGGRSAAVIAGVGKNQRLVFAGQEIQPGVRLVQVQAKRVLIKRSGMLESLRLQSPSDTSTSVAEIRPESSSPPHPATSRSANTSAPVVRPELLEKLNKLKSLAKEG